MHSSTRTGVDRELDAFERRIADAEQDTTVSVPTRRDAPAGASMEQLRRLAGLNERVYRVVHAREWTERLARESYIPPDVVTPTRFRYEAERLYRIGDMVALQEWFDRHAAGLTFAPRDTFWLTVYSGALRAFRGRGRRSWPGSPSGL
jgi:hypothetical protein